MINIWDPAWVARNNRTYHDTTDKIAANLGWQRVGDNNNVIGVAAKLEAKAPQEAIVATAESEAVVANASQKPKHCKKLVTRTRIP